MATIRIQDLELNTDLDREEMKTIFGGRTNSRLAGSFRSTPKRPFSPVFGALDQSAYRNPMGINLYGNEDPNSDWRRQEK